MIKEILKFLKPAFALIIIMTILTGVVYPLLVGMFARVLFPGKVDGSLVVVNQKIVGSKLIGQYFDDPKYFWGRPSATEGFPYNSLASGGSNMGPTNPELLTTVKHRIAVLRSVDPITASVLVPVDLVTASGSGLDPDISPSAAYYQAHRVAIVRNLPYGVVAKLIVQNITERQFGIFGEPRVNVLALNIALDDLGKDKK